MFLLFWKPFHLYRFYLDAYAARDVCKGERLCAGSPTPDTLKMSAHVKKIKGDYECLVFQKAWTDEYFFTAVKGNVLCLICGKQVTTR